MLRDIFARSTKVTPEDALIDAVLEQMHRNGPTSEEYPKLMTQLERLTDIKAKKRRDPVSRDTMLIVAGNLLGILLIVAYEQKHVLTSKGMTQVLRPKTE